jgi:2-dehydrotetronate isomerase
MIQVAANIGFFFKDKPLEERFSLAANAGFKLVETHGHAISPDDMVKICKDARVSLIGMNAGHGDKGTGIGAHETIALRESIDHAIEVCRATGAKNIHVLPGDIHHHRIEAEHIFVENLKYATAKAAPFGITILLEALNSIDRPAYFYNRLADVSTIIAKVGASNLKIMADIYHIGRSEGNVTEKLTRYWHLIGHVQVAGVPKRREIDEGEIHYPHILTHLKALGLAKPIGLEYLPENTVEQGLSYMEAYGLKF